MSAPTTLRTFDGAEWELRATTQTGTALYAVKGAPKCCPPYVMATLTELAEHGIQSAELAAAVAELCALPVPVGPERLSPEEREMILGLIGDAKPATSGLLVSFGESVRNRREHEHPTWEDLYCMNLSSYMGERMAPVLRRLVDVESENARLRASLREACDQVAALESDLGGATARVAELEAAPRERPVDEDPIAFVLTDKAEEHCDHPNCHGPYGCAGCGAFAPADDEDVTRQVRKLRNLLAGQRDAVAEAGDRP